jgi:NAD(P) transhydrogenase subunit alpha
MSFWAWILLLVVFFLVLKVAQIAFWNVRKSFYVHPWLVEIVVILLVVIALQTVASLWGLAVILGGVLGVLRGDQEAEDRKSQRQLL